VGSVIEMSYSTVTDVRNLSVECWVRDSGIGKIRFPNMYCRKSRTDLASCIDVHGVRQYAGFISIYLQGCPQKRVLRWEVLRSKSYHERTETFNKTTSHTSNK
jgi:hypothetical protein